jgi:hypothetical protein
MTDKFSETSIRRFRSGLEEDDGYAKAMDEKPIQNKFCSRPTEIER